VFVCWGDWNSSTGLQYVRYGIWDGSTWNLCPTILEHARYPKLSNTISTKSVPFVIYKAVPSLSVSLAEFNGTDAIDTWQNETKGSISISNYDVVVSYDSVVIALTEMNLIDWDQQYTIRILKGNIGDVPIPFHTLRKHYSPNLFVFFETSIGLLAKHQNNSSSTRRFMLYNLTDILILLGSIYFDESFSCSKVTSGSIEKIVIISQESSSSGSVKLWLVYSEPVGPLEDTMYYLIEPVGFQSVLPALILSSIVGLVILVAAYSRYRKRISSFRNMLASVAELAREESTSKSTLLFGTCAGIVMGYASIFLLEIKIPSLVTYQMSILFIPNSCRLFFFFVLPILSAIILFDQYSEFLLHREESINEVRQWINKRNAFRKRHPYFVFSIVTALSITLITESLLLVIDSIDFKGMLLFNLLFFPLLLIIWNITERKQ
jgi:hypothetical protein